MKRFLIPMTLAVALAVTSISAPATGYANSSELTQVKSQLDKVKREIAAAQKKEKQAQNEIKRIRNQRDQYSDEVERLESEIASTGKKLTQLHKQVEDVSENLELTTEELAAAEERVETRDALLKSRLRLMYMNGVVSYLDVLLSSTSFVDFLDRVDALQSIVSQDKEILELNIQDRETVEHKKQDVEAQLDYVEELTAQTIDLQKQLEVKKQNRQVAIASLEQQEEHYEVVSEQQEQELFELADKQAALVRKQKEIENKNSKKKVVKYTGGQLGWPVPSSDRITSMWGTRIHPITKKKHTHSGLDIGAPGGSTIVAAASGEVILAQWYGGYGNTVIVEHKEGFRTLYAHIRSGGIKVKVGDTVNKGDKIAEVGSTGNSTGNHLHFGVYVNNVSVDPLPYLR